MTKLEQLIEQLCPDGVEYKTIGELSSYRRGSFPQPYGKSEWYDGEGSMPFVQVADIGNDMRLISDTKRKISALAQPKSVFAPKGSIVISLQGSIGRIAITQYDAYIDRTVAIFNKVSKALINKYFVYQLQRIFGIKERTARGSTIKTITKEEFTSFLIPVPPLEVQAEIVRILDTFTELTTELTIELTTELANRKKQYEYYLNDVFRNVQAEYEPMEKYFPFIRNGFVGTVTSFFTDAEHGVRYLEGKNIHNGVISDNEILYVTKDFHKKHIRNELKPDDILMVQSGHVGECAVVGEKYAGANCHALIIMSNGGNINSKYVTYYFMSAEGKRKLEMITTGGTIKHILASGMKKVTIPVPPIEEQHRIVAILDRFDRLCNDISEGLPAEIKARQKQYEYYRDKLLTFNCK